MVALETRWHGPTNVRGSRISCRRMDADSNGRKTTVFESPDDAYCHERSHLPAVVKFCEMMGWHGRLVPGSTDRGYVWVWVPAEWQTPVAGYPEVFTV